MSDLTWQEITPETWRAEHGGNEALIIKDREAWRWLVNGGEMLPPVDEPGLSLETAKYAAKVVLELHPDRRPTPIECAAATTMAQGEAMRAWHEQASADLGLPPAPPPLPRPLVARIVDRAPPHVQGPLRERAESVGRYVAAIAALADESAAPETPPEHRAMLERVVAEMLEQAGGDAQVVAEAALEVMREHQRALAYAQTRKALAEEELALAQKEEAAEKEAIRSIKENVLRKLCESAGAGPTSKLKPLGGGLIYICKNAARVELEENALDYLDDSSGFVRITREADKKAIAAALGEGREVPGARLVQATRVEVRG
jgi:hypothetical protein